MEKYNGHSINCTTFCYLWCCCRDWYEPVNSESVTDSDPKSKGNPLWVIYLMVGTPVAGISLLSNIIFYTIGPGAMWHLGFIESSMGLFIGLFSSFLRVVTWPYGAYVLFNNSDGFLPWLLFPWYN